MRRMPRSAAPVLALFVAILPVETLKPVSALPAHLAGRVGDMAACAQTEDGRYVVFDRRAHAVLATNAARDDIRRIIEIGAEKGRLLRPTAFDMAGDGTFVVADAPGGYGRVQVFHSTGASLGGFTLPGNDAPVIVLDGMVLSGVASIEYTGRSVLVSQPETGSLVTEYALDGRVIRSFGTLRATGHEADPDVHHALNAGLPVTDPAGGSYFVFLAGTPLFRKYDASGRLVFERHIEGIEVDEYVRSLPGSWPRRRGEEGRELPVVRPGIRAAAADREGNLWVSLAAPFTYVYDPDGDKRRVVQLRAAGVLSPVSLSFTRAGRLLVAPGCYAF